MAINIGNIKTIDLWENYHKVLGLAINRSSSTGGPFEVNYTTLQQAKSNLVNLILTRKGERLAQPDLGCDIWRVLFDQIVDDELDAKVESSILEAVNNWLPYIQIEQIILDYDNEDIDKNGFRVEISFSLTANPNMSDSIIIDINN